MRQWHRSGVFIVTFEHVNADWVAKISLNDTSFNRTKVLGEKDDIHMKT